MNKSLLLVLILFAMVCPAWARLTSEQLVLVANKNLPDSVELARYYAKARNVDEARILLLDLPPSEQILPDQYESRLATPIRDYLKSPSGKQARCIVLFFGVPLQVRSQESTREDREEAAMLRRAIDELDKVTPQVAQDAEAFAVTLGITPRVIGGKGTGNAHQRVMSVLQQLQGRIAQLDPQRRQQVEQTIRAWQATLLTQGRKALDNAEANPAPTTQSSTSPVASTVPSTQPSTAPARAVTPVTQQQAQAWANQPRDAKSRQQLRQVIADQAGALILAQLLESQYAWISAEESDASVDSELSLIRFPDYPRFRWQPNPLHRATIAADDPQLMMTCRIDAPTPDIARRIIDDSIATEKNGLTGAAVFDSRGIPEKKGNTLDGYGWYDQAIRNAATFVGQKTRLKIVTDDRPQVILPNTVNDVALYIGWYSLQNYIPGCRFNVGAVGYHVASLELTSMRKPMSKEWVPNLLKDGIAATLGAVSEPYLHSFPRPEEFFPILLTGECTLAEVYWATLPLTSWKLILIGDPLYRPYAANPQLKAADLPERLRTAMQKIDGSVSDGR